MSFVRAKTNVYLLPEHGGYHYEGEEFDYNGPDNEHLEAAERGPYYGYTPGELKDELTLRGISIPPVADRKTLNDLLVVDDNQQA